MIGKKEWPEKFGFRTPNIALHTFFMCNVDFAKIGLKTCDT